MKFLFTQNLKNVLVVLFFFASISVSSAQAWMESAEGGKKPNFYKIQADFEKHWKDKKIEKGKGYKQFRRWEWYWESRTAPNGDFPEAGATYKAIKEYEAAYQQRRDARVEATTANWSFMGPTSSTGGYEGVGRLNWVAFHPTSATTFFAASPGGGVWKTTNDGASWTCLTDGLAAVGVSNIVVDHSNPNNLYIGTGDGYGNFDTKSIGVLKSTDGGATWNTTGLTWTTSQQRVIGAMIMHPTNAQTLFAATSVGIYRTTDGGATWSQMTTFHTQDIKFKHGDPTVMYATSYGGTTANIYRSTDSGATWTKITNFTTFNRINLAVTPANPELVGAACSKSSDQGFGGYYTSTNGGTSFALKFSSKNLFGWSATGNDTGGQGWYDLSVAISPSNANMVFIGGVNTWKSTDGGTTWNLNTAWTSGATYNPNNVAVVHADKHFHAFHPSTGALYECNDGGLYRTTNSGTSWTDLTNGMGITMFYGVSSAQTENNTLLAGAQDNGTKKRGSTGTWSMATGGDGMKAIVDFSNASYMYASYANGTIYRSTDGFTSQSYTTISANLPGGQQTGAWVTPYVMDPSSSTTLYAGYKDVYKTTNRGTSWTKISTNLSTTNLISLAVAPSAPNTIYAASYTNIYRTTNGSTWTNISTGLPFASAKMTYIAVHPTNSQIVYVTFSGYSSGNKVFKSTDGGATWTNVSGTLPNIPANCVTFDKNGNEAVYVGMDAGVYYRDATMTDWVLYNQSLPNTQVMELHIQYATGKLRAATYGRGVWQTDLYSNGTVTNPPTIASFSPTSGAVGTAVTITGTNFTGATAVRFNGTAATFTVNSATSISTTVPTGATTGAISVVNPDGTATSASNFTVTTGGVTYCASNATNSADSRINNVTFSNINNSSTTGCATYTDFTGITGNVSTNQTYSLSVTLGTCGGNYGKFGKVFIDWNADGDFDDAGENVATSASISATAAFTANVTVPSTATVGTTRMRVVAVEASAASSVLACGTYTYGETEDYTLNVSAGSAPTPPTITSFSPTSGTVGTAVTITGTNFTGATAVRFNGTAATFTVVSATSITTSVPSGATTGAVSVVTPDGTATSSTSFTVNTVVSYCASNATSTADSRINNVTFAGINNSSTSGCATYTNFTNLSGNVAVGQTYSISVTLGTCNGNYTKYGKVFIDWNGDGDFIDAGETVATSAAIASTAAFTANVTVPAGATTGSTRMRVVCVETSSAANVVSCGTYTYGETEDYTINVTATPIATVKGGREEIGKDETTFEVLLYPNPVQSVLNLELKNVEVGSKLLIVNTLGVAVWTSEVKDSKVSINTTDLANGVYILQVRAKDKLVQHKFVKQ